MKFAITSAVLAMLLSVSVVAQKPDSSVRPETKPSPAAVKLPAGKEVVDKYVKAVGGREALAKLKTRYQTGTIEMSPMGIKGTVEAFFGSDDRYLLKGSLAGVGDLIEGYDGKTAWSINPLEGRRIKDGKELLQTKRLNALARDAMLDAVYSSLTVRGIEKVGDREAFAVVASSQDLPDDILFFDKESCLLLRRDSIVITPAGNQALSTFFEDYREVNGVKTPFRERAKTPAFEMISSYTEIKYNVPIEDSKFVQPK